MEKVLVIGGAGYIGSHTLKILKEAGYSAVVFDDLSSGHKEAVLGTKLVVGKISDKKLLSKVMKEEKIYAVLHFAGKIEVGESVNNPCKYFKNNCLDGVNILLAMIENGIKNFIFSSTAAVYGEPSKIPTTEAEKTLPSNPYGLSKLMFEDILKYYERQKLINYISLRYFNAAGADIGGYLGADHPKKTHLITKAVLTSLGVEEKFQLFGTDYNTPDGTCIRDYVHVTDLAKAHVLALELLINKEQSVTLNLGSESGSSNKQVIQTVKKICGDFNVEEAPRRAGDSAVLIASSKKAKKILGWRPKYSDLETIVRTAYNWHKTHPNGYDFK